MGGARIVRFHAFVPSMYAVYCRVLSSLASLSMVMAPNFEFPKLIYLYMLAADILGGRRPLVCMCLLELHIFTIRLHIGRDGRIELV